MIELIDVEVKNFRSFSEATFSPLGIGQGLTALNGANGSGKSSIATHALLWALFGQTPEGVAVKALRRQGSEGEVYAKVRFRHNGQVVEVTRSLRGRNDTTNASIKVDGVEQTNVSSRTATTWVENRLNINAEAFTTAFVVRQKEVDSLVKARPAERRALIERLAGIDRMSEALSKAREEARGLNAQVAAYKETADIEELQSQASDRVAYLEKVQEQYLQAKTKLKDLEESLSQKETYLTQVETVHVNYKELLHAVELAAQELKIAEENLENTELQAEAADLLPDAQAAVTAAREARIDAEKIIEKAKTALENAEKKDREVQEALEEQSKVSKIHENKEKALQSIEQAISLLDSDLELKLQQIQEIIEIKAEGLGAAKNEIARLNRAIQALESTTHEGNASCPTCSSLLENPHILLETMRKDYENAQREYESKEASLKDSQAEGRKLKSSLEEKNDLIRKKNTASQEFLVAQSNLEQAERKVSLLSEESETLAEDAHHWQSQALLVEEEYEKYSNAERKAQESLRKAENAVEAEEKLPELQAKVDEKSSKFQDLVLERTELEKTLPSEPLEEMKESIKALRTQVRVLSDEANELKQNVLIAERDMEDATKSLQKAQEVSEIRKKMLEAASIGQAVASALEEFRRDRIARLAPELSEIASDIITVMTDGKYSTVELDEDFTPILTESATGLQRPTAWLSGGEESAVALALRIAIGEVVSGQEAGLLVLDEVLTAQDKDRRASVMGAIKSLGTRQLITINHISEATDMVDLVAHVVPAEEGGYTVEHSAGGAATFSDVSNIDEKE